MNSQSDKPKVLYFNIDNLGYGELGCYGGGVFARGG